MTWLREETLTVVALVLSFLALLVAFWAAVSSRRAARAADVLAKNDVERRSEERKRQELAEVAAKRANLRVRHETATIGGVDYLMVTNKGPALARYVGIEVVGVDGGDRPPRLVVQPGEQPVEELPPGDSVRFPLDIDGGAGHSLQVRLTWNDGEEARHDQRRSVQFP
jgi:Na+-transporting methylmalonyl-CoA/oxaloacetate decarboxylase gamma subunit